MFTKRIDSRKIIYSCREGERVKGGGFKDKAYARSIRGNNMAE